MKLTPEQKVFIEYGKAKKALEIAKKRLAKEMRRYLSRHQARDYNNIDILIRDVWRKRAACRDWVAVPLANRNCENRANSVVNPIPEVCKICVMTNFSGWEPIKWNK